MTCPLHNTWHTTLMLTGSCSRFPGGPPTQSHPTKFHKSDSTVVELTFPRFPIHRGLPITCHTAACARETMATIRKPAQNTPCIASESQPGWTFLVCVGRRLDMGQSLSMQRRQRVLMTGLPGAGKSTMVKMLCGKTLHSAARSVEKGTYMGVEIVSWDAGENDQFVIKKWFDSSCEDLK